MLNRTLDNVII